MRFQLTGPCLACPRCLSRPATSPGAMAAPSFGRQRELIGDILARDALDCKLCANLWRGRRTFADEMNSGPLAGQVSHLLKGHADEPVHVQAQAGDAYPSGLYC